MIIRKKVLAFMYWNKCYMSKCNICIERCNSKTKNKILKILTKIRKVNRW